MLARHKLQRLGGPPRTTAPGPVVHQPARPTLVDVPVSNNGARVRFVIYKKGLKPSFDIVSPQTLGGLKGERYLSLNPQGKMPVLLCPDGGVWPESEVRVTHQRVRCWSLISGLHACGCAVGFRV